jgi:hypothetical protein
MKKLLSVLFSAVLLGTGSGCKPGGVDPGSPQAEAGVVTGHVVDAQGRPVAGAEIVASNTDWFNKTTTGYTDARGTYRFKLPTGVAEGSYTASGTVTVKYHGRTYKLALYEENSRVFSAYDGAVRDFVFRLTGKRTADSDDDPARDLPLGGTLEVHHQIDEVVWENLEITLEPVGALIDGSTGRKLVRTMPAADYRLYDIPLGQYKITARDRVTGQPLNVTIKDSAKPFASSVTALFNEKDFSGDTRYELLLLVEAR